jgi:type IV secretory pathway VirJ component
MRTPRGACGWIALVQGLLLPLILSSCAVNAAPPRAAVGPARAAADSFNYDRFGTVTIYRGHGRPREAVLLLSGDGGWDAAMGLLAQHLADTGALVAGIDLPHYRTALEHAAETCVSPGSDLENLSHYLQSKLAVKSYLEPILVGYQSGGTLAYATLVEAPEGLFKGALSIGFSADLELKKALCDSPAMTPHVLVDAGGAVRGLTVTAATQLPGRWIVLLGDADQSATGAADAAAVRKFVSAVPGAEWVNLPRTGANYPVDPTWMPSLDAAVGKLAAVSHEEAKPVALPQALADLPLIEVPARGGSGGQWFGVFLTGDGGWVGLDKGVSTELAKHDIPIIGWDSLKYFWKRRTPEGAAHDLDRVLRYYAHAWGRSHVLLIGYSQGADTMPFMFNRLPADTHSMVGYTTLLGISDNALWEFHVATWLGKPPKGIPTAPELERWKGSPYLCIYGESDADAACEQETGHDGTALKLSGGHHFGGGYDKIAEEILSRLPPISGASPAAGAERAGETSRSTAAD